MVYNKNANRPKAFRGAYFAFAGVESATKVWNISTNGAQR